MEYSWCEYYRKAYEKEKKANTLLAGKTADAEAKREELQAKYETICANPLYKASRVPSLLKRGVRKAINIVSEKKGDSARGQGGGAEAQAEELFASYQERLRLQRDRYGQWIREEEPVLWERCLSDLAREKRAGERTERTGDSARRRCRIVSCAEIAGITELGQALCEEKERDVVGENAGQGCTGQADILLFAEDVAGLDERAVSYIEDFFGAYPHTKLLYGAEDYRTGEQRSFPWFKPCFSPDTLLGFFYFGSFFAVDRTWAENVPLSGYADARQNLYDFVLRLLKPYFGKPQAVRFEKEKIWRTGGIYHPCDDGADFPEIVCTDLVLYHRNDAAPQEETPDREYFLHTGEMKDGCHAAFWGYEKAYLKLKQDFLNNIGYECFSYQTSHPDVWSVVPAGRREASGDAEEWVAGTTEGERTDGEKKTVLLSVIIPSKDHPELVEKCIGSFLERTYLPGLREKVEFIVADNGSGEENRRRIQAYLESLQAACHYLYQPMEFNFSAMCNLGARSARGEYILLLNDDIEVVEKNWLRIMLGQAYLPGVGAVGAKLWYPGEEKMQHAGVTNMHVGPSHKMTTFPDDRTYYYGHNTVPYDMIGVTAACLLIKKTVFEEAGGLDESMAVAYNDVDLCFTLAERGYRNVLRSDAVLLHHESASRGLDGESAEKWGRLLREKAKLYEKHPLFLEYDPYYSEQLAGFALEYRIGYQYPYERPFLTAKPERRERKKELEKVLSGAVMLTVEQIENRKKLHLEEPDILEAEGWCYMLNQDNCLYERWFVLEAEQGDHYYRFPVQERRRPDVEAILPLQKNIELSGFTCKILKEDITSGRYAVGMLYRNLCSGKMTYQRSGIILTQ